MNLKFYLKEPSEKTSQIYARLSGTKAEVTKYGASLSKRVKVYLPLFVKTEFWDQKLQRVKQLRKYPDCYYINDVLAKVEMVVKQVYQKAVLDGRNLATVDFKDEILTSLGGQSADDMSVVDLFEQFISDCENGVRLKEDGSKLEEESIRAYKNGQGVYKAYEGYIGMPLLGKSIGDDFPVRYEQFCKEKGFSHNYRVTMVKRLKAVLNYFNKDGKYDQALKNVKNIKANYEQSDTIALTKDEIQAIYDLDLSGDPYLDKIRDCFIAEYCTLTRYSDAARIKELNLKDSLIKIVTKKTKATVEIPYHWMLKEIIQKYGEVPKPPVSQYYNRAIKEVVRKAGITANEEIKVKKGGHTYTEVHPRYSLVSSHTARRSAATNMVLDGIPWDKIMPLTGHSSRETFAVYIRVNKTQNALDLAKHSFFTGK